MDAQGEGGQRENACAEKAEQPTKGRKETGPNAPPRKGGRGRVRHVPDEKKVLLSAAWGTGAGTQGKKKKTHA